MTRPNTLAARVAVGLSTLALLGGCTAGTTSPPSAAPTRVQPSPSASPAPSTAATPSPSPSPLATEAPVATPLPTLSAEPRWERLPDQEAFANAQMVAVAGGPDRYVAVGRATVGDGYVGAAWTSTDGVAWRRAPAPLAGTSPDGVIHDRDGYVAWGGGTAFWTSPDGLAWNRSARPLGGGEGDPQVTGVARLGDVLVAVGYAEIASGEDFVREFRTWTSPDGRAWTSVNPVTSIPWDGYVDGVTAADGALVAWGYARAGESFPPVTLRSTDGRRWQVGGVKPGAEGYMREGILEAIGIGGRLVAVGYGLVEEGEGMEPPPSAAWTSADGLTWMAASFEPQPATGWLGNLAWYAGEYVALGRTDLDPVVWRSVDGTTWTRSASAPDAGRDGAEECSGGSCPNTEVYDLAAGPAGLVAVGGSRTATGERHVVVWIAPAD